MNGIADELAIQIFQKQRAAHYADFAVMQRALRVVSVRNVGCARLHRGFHFRILRARVPDGNHRTLRHDMPDKIKRAVRFGGKRDDFYGVAARRVVFVERFRVGRRHVFQRLRALVRRRDKRTFEVNARDPRALFARRFAVFFHRAHRL